MRVCWRPRGNDLGWRSGAAFGSPQLFRRWLATMQYQSLRSVSDNHVFVVCHDGTFYESVPEKVRHQGPWQVNRRGEIERLKPEYRLALARDGSRVPASARTRSLRAGRVRADGVHAGGPTTTSDQ